MINRTGLALLALGALLFAGVFYAATTYNILGWTPDAGSGEGLSPPLLIGLYTIAFGLPYALGELARKTNWVAVLYLVILVPAAHYGAIYAFLWMTAEGQEINSLLTAGAFGGFVGSALSFLTLFLLGLRAPGAGPLAFGAGLIVLAAWGGVGMWLINPEGEGPLTYILPLFLPWQLLFAFFLSALLRPSPKRGAVATV